MLMAKPAPPVNLVQYVSILPEIEIHDPPYTIDRSLDKLLDRSILFK